MFLGDLHVHSTFSDGKHTIPEIIDLYGTRGFGVIAITDHVSETETLIGKAAIHLGLSVTEANFPLYSEILASEAERAWKQYKMVVIKGLELSKNSVSNHRSAHILALGIERLIRADGEIPNLIHQIHDEGALAIAAHPVASGKIEKQTYHLWDRREELGHLFDAWEVASGAKIFKEVAETPLPKLANSDLHQARQMRAWKTVFHCERNPQAILEAIKKQKIGFRFYEEAPNVPTVHPVGTRRLSHFGWNLRRSVQSSQFPSAPEEISPSFYPKTA